MIGELIRGLLGTFLVIGLVAGVVVFVIGGLLLRLVFG